MCQQIEFRLLLLEAIRYDGDDIVTEKRENLSMIISSISDHFKADGTQSKIIGYIIVS